MMNIDEFDLDAPDEVWNCGEPVCEEPAEETDYKSVEGTPVNLGGWVTFARGGGMPLLLYRDLVKSGRFKAPKTKREQFLEECAKYFHGSSDESAPDDPEEPR